MLLFEPILLVEALVFEEEKFEKPHNESIQGTSVPTEQAKS